jgi:hypothetical protein
MKSMRLRYSASRPCRLARASLSSRLTRSTTVSPRSRLTEGRLANESGTRPCATIALKAAAAGLAKLDKGMVLVST